MIQQYLRQLMTSKVRTVRGRRQRNRLLTSQSLESRQMLTSLQAELVADLVPGGNSSEPSDLVAIGDAAYFVAFNNAFARTIYSTDGTSQNTAILNDSIELDPTFGNNFLTAFGADLAYARPASGEASGPLLELWTVDTNSAEPQFVADLLHPDLFGTPPDMLSGFEGLTAMVSVGNRLVFVNNDGITGTELWVSDGTSAGTENVNIGVEDADNELVDSFPENLTVAGNSVFFTASDVNAETQLYVTDGTVAGTQRLTDGLSQDALPTNFFATDDGVYFQAASTSNGVELWFSDGTAAGTLMVADVHPGAGSSHPTPIAIDGETLYFAANDGTLGRELWKTDGTAAGTSLVADIAIGPASSISGFSEAGAVANGKLLFSASTSTHGRELWVSDGTADGTELVSDLAIGSDGSGPSGFVAAANGAEVLFHADAGAGTQSWVSDGTSAGTVVLPGDAVFVGSDAVVIGDALISAGTNDSVGTELFKVTGPGLPTISFAAPELEFAEGVITSVEVTLSSPVSATLTIPIQASGTAQADADFSFDGSVTIHEGATSGTFLFSTLTDGVYEANETVTLQFGALPDSINVGGVSQQVITITNQDALPQYSWATGQPNAVPVDEIEAGFSFPISLTRPADQDVFVQVAIDGSATLGNDFTVSAPGTSIRIPAGEITADFSLELIDDLIGENSESIVLQLSSGTIDLGPDLSPAAGGLTEIALLIGPNDVPIFDVQTSSEEVREGQAEYIEVTLSGPQDSDLVIPASATFLTGSADGVIVDFNAATTAIDSDSVVFPAGQTTTSIVVFRPDDQLQQEPTQVEIFLEPSAGVIGHNTLANITVVDNDLVQAYFGPSRVVEEGQTQSIFVLLSNPATFDITIPVSITNQSFDVALTRPLGHDLSAQDVALINFLNTNPDLGAIATPDLDFSTTLPDVFIPAGATSAEIQIATVDDTLHEPFEAATLVLGTPIEGVELLASNGAGTDEISRSIIITDNDPELFVIAGSSISEDGSTDASFLISETSQTDVVVPFSFAGDAINGVDFGKLTDAGEIVAFQPEDLIITIPAGERRASFTVHAIDDSVFEFTENIVFAVDYPTIADGSRLFIELHDNDSKPVVSFRSTFIDGNEGDGRIELPIDLNQTLPENLLIPVVQLNGTSGLLTVEGLTENNEILIPAGQRSATLVLRPVDNDTYTRFRTSHVFQLGASPAYESRNFSATVQIRDNDNPPLPPYVRRRIEASRQAIKNQPEGQTRLPDPANCTSHGNTAISASQIILPASALCGQSSIVLESGVPLENANNSSVTSTGNQSVSAFEIILPVSFQNGPVDGATIFFDANRNRIQDFVDLNGNGQLDQNEPFEPSATTALNGLSSFVLSSAFDRNGDGVVDQTEGQFVGSGGIDVSIGQEVSTQLLAPVGFRILTPLTTVISRLTTDHGFSADAAHTRLRDAGNILNFDLRTQHPLFNAVGGNVDAARTYVLQLQVQSIVAQTTALLQPLFPALTSQTVADEVYGRIASRIAAPNSRFNLTSSQAITAIVSETAQRLAIPLPKETANAAGRIMAGFNQRYANVQLTADEVFGNAVVQVKSVAYTQSVAAMNQMALGQLSTTDAENQLTGNAADTLIGNAIPGLLAPPVIQAVSMFSVEGDADATTLEFDVTVFGQVEQAVTTDWTLVLGRNDNATVIASGTLSWEPGDDVLQILTLDVPASPGFSGDLTYDLLLTNPQGAALESGGAVGFVINDDPFEHLVGLDTELNGTVRLELTDDFVIFTDNAGQKFQSDILFDTQFSITGQPSQADELTIVPASRENRDDSISFDGESGDDAVNVRGGSYTAVSHSVQNPFSSNTRFNGLADDYLTVETLDTQIARLLFDVTETLTIQLPDGDFSFVLEDIDTADANPQTQFQSQLREVNGRVQTVVFNSPTTTLQILTGVGNEPVRIDSIDPRFTGDLQVLEPDTQSPGSFVQSVAEEVDSTFDINVSFADQQLANMIVAGVQQIEVFYLLNPQAENNEPQLLTTVDLESSMQAGTVALTFDAVVQSGDVIQLWSVATDVAGNRQDDGIRIDASTVIADTSAPQTQVVSATFDGEQQIDLKFTGVDIGGGVVESFDVFVEIDPGTASASTQLLATVNAGDESAGSFSGDFSFLVVQDGTAHSYRFFTIGTDQKNNREGGPGVLDGDPGMNADQIVNDITVAAPAAAEIVDFDINGGLNNRSTVKQIDTVFNDEVFLAELLSSLNDANPANDRIRLERKDLSGDSVGSGDYISVLPSMLQQTGGRLTLNLPANGLTDNGIYALQFDMDNDTDNGFEQQRTFHRLAGDVNGDGVVDRADLLKVRRAYRRPHLFADADLDGNGIVDRLDVRFFSTFFRQATPADRLLFPREDLDD